MPLSMIHGLFDFYDGKAGAEFLINADVIDYLAEIPKRTLDMRMHQRIYERLPDGDERSSHIQAEDDQLAWLGEQFKATTAVFTPYLGCSAKSRRR
jgi:hypothetical protein